MHTFICIYLGLISHSGKVLKCCGLWSQCPRQVRQEHVEHGNFPSLCGPQSARAHTEPRKPNEPTAEPIDRGRLAPPDTTHGVSSWGAVRAGHGLGDSNDHDFDKSLGARSGLRILQRLRTRGCKQSTPTTCVRVIAGSRKHGVVRTAVLLCRLPTVAEKGACEQVSGAFGG